MPFGVLHIAVFRWTPPLYMNICVSFRLSVLMSVPKDLSCSVSSSDLYSSPLVYFTVPKGYSDTGHNETGTPGHWDTRTLGNEVTEILGHLDTRTQ